MSGSEGKRDQVQAFELIEKAAAQDLPEAVCQLGYCYEKGFGTQVNLLRAFENYKKSAEMGVAAGQNNLGYMYEHGFGTQRDPVKAVACYEQAARQGLKEAKFNLASMYERGYGTARNMRKALGLYEESLALGMTTGEKAIHRVERAMQRKRMGVLLLGSAGALTAATVLWQVARKILGGSR